jgi:hypothetical protein
MNRRDVPTVTQESREAFVVAFEDEHPTVDYRGGVRGWGSPELMRVMRDLFDCGSDEEIVSIEVDRRGVRVLVRKDYQ